MLAMDGSDTCDAVIIGAGPNGLSAAIALAQAGCSVRVFERSDMIGGGMRSMPLTLDGFTHDVCSAIHPLAVSSPFLKSLALEEHGLEWVHPTLALAHPHADGTATCLPRSLDDFARVVGHDRAAAWIRIMRPFVEQWERLAREMLQPPIHVPKHPGVLLRFSLGGIRSASAACRAWFHDEKVRALFAGCAAHAMAPLEQTGTAAFGLMLGASAHAVGWPFPRGGSQQLANAMARKLESLGGEIETSHYIERWSQLPRARAYLFDTAPRALVAIAGDRLPQRFHRAVRHFRYGMGVFKIDWALSEPIPWRAESCCGAGTLHIGGSLEEIEQSERSAWNGKVCEQPFALLAQQSVFDDSRAPAGKHTAWAYCHAPLASTVDMTSRIEAQIERFAPGFRDCILARHTMNAQQMQAHNPNNIGGDINGGAATLRQLLFRPMMRRDPYATPNPSIFLCSASTPPGGGVHGMCGFHAARSALRGVLRSKRV